LSKNSKYNTVIEVFLMDSKAGVRATGESNIYKDGKVIVMAREKSSIASMIDHTLLKPEATVSQIYQLCDEAKKYQFASVCVNPCYVRFAYELLKNSSVKVCTVVGFPLGATTMKVKVAETKEAIENGASEIDMVIPIGALKAGEQDLVQKDIEAVVMAAKEQAIVKVIIETCLLTREETAIACILAKEAGADFVKTSTGFSTAGATLENITLMRHVVGPQMGVKASGGIRDYQTAKAMVHAGASRIGASASIEIVKQETRE
jgi:deoxyribose-phosphate aldolase